MKKLILAVAILLAAVTGNFLWRYHVAQSGRQHAFPGLRAMMRDEDEARPIEPSVSLGVNEHASARVFVGTAVWFTVGISNAAAADEIASSRVLAERLSNMSDEEPGRAQLQAHYSQRSVPTKIVIGSPDHPWTDAIQLLVRDKQGAERPFGLALQRLGNTENVEGLDAENAARVNFGAVSLKAAPGTYSLVACLTATGSWKGRACSDSVQLTVKERAGNLSRQQQQELDEQGARYALLASDTAGLEEYGRRLLSADPKSISGHIYLGEANYGQAKWQEAFDEFNAATIEFSHRYPEAHELPVFLVARKNEIIHRLMQRNEPVYN